jgi:4-hydroxy-tetrahydrodipicolinate reductase
MSIRPRILLAGATGKTGNAIAHGLVDRDDVDLVAAVAPSLAPGATPTRSIPEGIACAATIGEIVTDWDVLVDVTHAEPGLAHAREAFAAGKHVVLGTTGIADDDLIHLGAMAKAAGVGLLYVPNFAIGAVLMMRFAAEAAKYLDDVEIVEIHHAAKLDAPSGTARRTAQLVAAARGTNSHGADSSGARGEVVDGVHVHSLRLPGAVAHQTVTASAPGELLEIRHDALDRGCYAAGVARAARGVREIHGLAIGLEQVL